MIKASSVFELFNGHPERWTRGALARRADGSDTTADDEKAVAFCMVGACQRVYGVGNAKDEVLRIREACGGSAVEFNRTHTFEEVVDAVRRSGV